MLEAPSYSDEEEEEGEEDPEITALLHEKVVQVCWLNLISLRPHKLHLLSLQPHFFTLYRRMGFKCVVK